MKRKMRYHVTIRRVAERSRGKATLKVAVVMLVGFRFDRCG